MLLDFVRKSIESESVANSNIWEALFQKMEQQKMTSKIGYNREKGYSFAKLVTLVEQNETSN